MIKIKLLIMSDHKRLTKELAKLASPRFECLVASSTLIVISLLETNIDDIAFIVMDDEFIDSLSTVSSNIDPQKLTDIPLLIISNKKSNRIDLSRVINTSINIARSTLAPKTILSKIQSLGNSREETIRQRIIVEDCFIEESKEISDAVHSNLKLLNENPTEKDTISTIHRLTHTMNGSSAIAGFHHVSAYAKKYEEMLLKLKKDPSILTQDVLDVMAKGAIVIDQMLDCVKNKKNWTQSVEELTQIFRIDAPEPPWEAARQSALDKLRLSPFNFDQRYNDLTELATILFRMPICLITIIDRDCQWFKGKTGLNLEKTSRDISFCGHAILQPDIFLVEDARIDPRFAGNSLVTSSPNIVFYAGQPLITSAGQAIGTLCLIDHEPRNLSANEIKALKILAEQVITLIELSAVAINTAA